jgi:hypothetical protein
MKLLHQVVVVAPFCFTTGQAFVASSAHSSARVVRFAADYVPMEGEGKINLKVRRVEFRRCACNIFVCVWKSLPLLFHSLL